MQTSNLAISFVAPFWMLVVVYRLWLDGYLPRNRKHHEKQNALANSATLAAKKNSGSMRLRCPRSPMHSCSKLTSLTIHCENGLSLPKLGTVLAAIDATGLGWKKKEAGALYCEEH